MSEIKIERIKCNTPFFMTIDLCKNCGRKAEKIEEGVEYETYHPKYTRFNGYKCDMYEHRDQGDLF